MILPSALTLLVYLCCCCWLLIRSARIRPIPAYMQKRLEGGRQIYDKQATPTQSMDTPTRVNISMYIEGLSSFRAQTMDFQLDVYFQQYWRDARLRHNESYRLLIRDRDILLKMWHPDIYFANARIAQFHDVTQQNFLVWIDPDGSILYDTRISMIVMCMMQLEKWPLDEQFCNLRILSYAYDMTQMTIEWNQSLAEPITRNPGIEMSDMHIESMHPGLCDGNYTTGAWSCVTAEFHVKREIMHHVLQSYVPTTLIVIISWFSFWLDVDAVPARVSLAITTLLTLSTQANAARMALPEVSYMKAIDVWMGTCMLFVFGVMIEFTIVNYAQRQGSMHLEESEEKTGNFGKRAIHLFGKAARNLHASKREPTTQLRMRAVHHQPSDPYVSVIGASDHDFSTVQSPMMPISSISSRESESPLPANNKNVTVSKRQAADSRFSPPCECGDQQTEEEAAAEQRAYRLIRRAMQRRGVKPNSVDVSLTADTSSATVGRPPGENTRLLSVTSPCDDSIIHPTAQRLANWSNAQASMEAPVGIDNQFLLSPSCRNATTTEQPRLSGWAKLRNIAGGSTQSSSPAPSGGATSQKGGDRWGNLMRQIQTRRRMNGRKAAKKIDQRSRWGFPLAFAIFNACYWTYYLYMT